MPSAVSLHSEKILGRGLILSRASIARNACCVFQTFAAKLQLYDLRSGFRPDACQNGKFSVVGLVLWLPPSFCLLLGFPLV